jgi:GAF domain-containing protein
LAGLARLQEDAQAGPGADAVHTRRPVVVDRLETRAARWPAYVRRAAELGVVAVLSVPVGTAVPVGTGAPIGTLDVGHDAALDWSVEQVEVVRSFADLAAAIVAMSSAFQRQRRTVDQLQTALDSRILIEQAKGIVAAQRGVTVERAFTVLRRYANDRNLTLRSVADAVVHRDVRP